MPVYLISHRNRPLDPPRVVFGTDVHDACANAGLKPALARVLNITRRTLSPKSLNNTPLTPDFLDLAPRKDDE